MLLRLFGVSLVLCAVVAGVVSSSPTCSGAVCYATMNYPDHFAIYNQTIYTGIRNGIVQLTLDLEELQHVESFDPVMNQSCHRSTNTIDKDANCHNYHRTIVFPRGDLTIVGEGSNASANDTFIACSTNFLSPICQYRLVSNLSLVKNQTGAGFCPQLAETGTAFVESNTTLWVGTITDGAEDGAVSQSRTPFNGRVFHATIVNSVFWLKASSFVDMYELGEYVYTFLREIPVEINPAEVRSRVARVCKSDAGVFTGRQQIFQTYLKSSVRCEVEGLSTAEQRYRDVSFFFNDLYDTTVVDSGTYNAIESSVRPKLLYGVFQNSGNGPVGSAVCVFSFDHTENDITTVFQGDYLTRTPNNVWSRSTNSRPINCSQGRSLQEAERDIVMYNDVEQLNPASSPLYLKNGYRFQKIAVGQVTALDGIRYEVMFIAVQDDEGNMQIAKVSYVSRRSRQKSVEHDIIELDQSDYRVNHMQYYQSNGQDMLYVSTPARLIRINPLDCSAYMSCTECVGSMDPYCAYDIEQAKCVGVNTANQNSSMQNITGGVANCPITAIPTPSSSIIGTTSSGVIVTPTSGTVRPEPSSGSSSNDMWAWLGIGGGTGFLIGLAVGFVIMFAWHRKVGVFSHCRDSGSNGRVDELSWYTRDEDHKKSAANHYDNEPSKPGASDHFKSSPYHENGHVHRNGHLPNGQLPNGHCPPSVKSKNNYDVTDDPPPGYDSKEAKCNRSQSLYQRRTAHPVEMLKMAESPQKMRSASMVPVTSEPVTNRDMARYGSNYSLDPESAKPTLTPKPQVYYDPINDSIDLDHSLHKSTDC